MAKYFGTDGMRGEANMGFMTPAMLLKLAQSFGVILKKRNPRPKVLIGKDTRVSGYMIEGILASGLCSVGVDVLFVGPLPTPGIAYLTRGMRANAGMMISASHNSFQDNGIKLFDHNGFKLPDSEEVFIEQLMDSSDLDTYLVKSEHLGRAKRIDDAIGQYAVFLKERFPKNLKLDGKTIVLDCAHGAGYKVAPKVFEELGAKVISIHNDPNGFNINLNCGALHPQILSEKVKEYNADIGFALDGDADRLIVVDEQGNILDGDSIIVMCALEMHAQNQLKNNGVCVTIMSNKGLDVALQKTGIRVVRTKVGDRYVMESMLANDLILGGEQSGHLIFLDSSTTGDAIIACLKILEMMCHTHKKISQLTSVMMKLPQITKNVRVSAKPPLETLFKTLAVVREFEDELGASGRILMRYSGTEPLVRITLEGVDQYRIEEMANIIEKTFLAEIGQ